MIVARRCVFMDAFLRWCFCLVKKFTVVFLFFFSLNFCEVHAGLGRAVKCAEFTAEGGPVRALGAEVPSVPIVTVSSWETLHFVVDRFLGKINYVEPTFVQRSIGTDRLQQVLATGTDRDETSINWNGGVDASPEEQKRHGITTSALIYAYLISRSSFAEFLAFDGEWQDSPTQNLKDILKFNLKDSLYDHSVIYRTSGLIRASSVEFWFKGHPRDSILAVFKSALPEDGALPLDDLALKEIEGKLLLDSKDTEDLLDSLLRSLPWEKIDGFVITDARTHRLWNFSEKIEIGLLPTREYEEVNDSVDLKNAFVQSNSTFPRPLSDLLDDSSLITKETDRQLKITVHNHMFDVNHISKGLRPQPDNPFLGLPVPLNSDNPKVRSEYRDLFYRLNLGAARDGLGFHTQDAVFVLKSTSTSNRDAARLRELGYRYIYSIAK